MTAMPIWWRLLAQLTRWAVSRIFCTATMPMAAMTAIMPMTTRISINVKARRKGIGLKRMTNLLPKIRNSKSAFRRRTRGNRENGELVISLCWLCYLLFFCFAGDQTGPGGRGSRRAVEQFDRLSADDTECRFPTSESPERGNSLKPVLPADLLAGFHRARAVMNRNFKDGQAEPAHLGRHFGTKLELLALQVEAAQQRSRKDFVAGGLVRQAHAVPKADAEIQKNN